MIKMKRYFNIVVNLAITSVCLFLLWILAQVFVFASFRIPSDSMSPGLREGDFVLVWKPVVGARLFNLNKSLNLEQTDIYRLPGFRNIKRNDVVVFNFPHPNDWNHIEMHIMKYYIKRCIGLPGDTLSIRKGMFKVKGVDIPLGNVASQKYNPQIQISAESETKRSIFREKDKTKRSKKESAQHSKSRNKSFVMTSVSAL